MGVIWSALRSTPSCDVSRPLQQRSYSIGGSQLRARSSNETMARSGPGISSVTGGGSLFHNQGVTVVMVRYVHDAFGWDRWFEDLVTTLAGFDKTLP